MNTNSNSGGAAAVLAAILALFLVLGIGAGGAGWIFLRQRTMIAREMALQARMEAEVANKMAQAQLQRAEEILIRQEQQDREQVNLEHSGQTDQTSRPPQELLKLVLSSEGAIYLNQHLTDLAALTDQIQQLGKPTEMRVEIEVDKACPAAALVKVFTTCQQLGIQDVKLETLD